MKEIVPQMKDPQCIFSDGCIEDTNLFRGIFPSTTLLLCAFHIISLDLLSKMRFLHGFEEVKTLMHKMRDAPYQQQFDEAWSTLKTNHAAAAR